MHTVWPAHLDLLDSITLILFLEEDKLLNSYMCDYLPSLRSKHSQHSVTDKPTHSFLCVGDKFHTNKKTTLERYIVLETLQGNNSIQFL
jgi:hypothetical protein